MKLVTIHEAKTHFSRLINRALSGEEIVIARGRKPVVKIVPLPEAMDDRVLGNHKEVVKWISDDFDEPLEEFEAYMK